MTYNVFTIGCQMNKADSERLFFYLENLGFLPHHDFLQADLVIFVTCGVRQSAEDRIYGLIERIYRKNKKTVIALTGCLSDRPDVRVRIKNKVNIFFNISSLPSLSQELEKFFPKIKANLEFKLRDYLDISAKRSSSFSAFVPIGNGCNNFCSYCVVPYARGREIYRPATKIVKEVKSLVKDGYKEINLIAQNVNSYQSTCGSKKFDFADLLKAIDNIPGDFWIRFSSSHPKDVSPRLIKVLAESSKVVEHFHLALQSGDDDILRLMNRKYKFDDYRQTVKKIREAFAKRSDLPASITTDIIVGFPGEKRKNFLNTVKAFRELQFDLAYIAKYSPRYGTVSSQMLDDVPLSEKKRRELELNTVLKKIALKNNKTYLGREVDVLLEGLDRNNNLFGKTRTNKIVKIKTSAESLKEWREKIGSFVRVKITKAFEFELSADLLDSEDDSKKNKGAARASSKKKKDKVIVVLGPTASGKTALAVSLAHKFKGEILSADSRQVYQGMDIGTGKDLADYFYQGENIPYHLIDVSSPKNKFSLAKYQKLAFKSLKDILERKKLPLIVGGSGLYLEALVDNYDLSSVKPSFKNREVYEQMDLSDLQKEIKKINPKFFSNLNNSDLHNKRRLSRYLEIFLNEESYQPRKKEGLYGFLLIGLSPDREELREKIHRRLKIRLEEEGMIAEVEKLKASGLTWKQLDDFGLEYRFIARYLQGKITYQQLESQLFTAISQFSKRQMTWFRRWEKHGQEIKWIKKSSEAERLVSNFIKK